MENPIADYLIKQPDDCALIFIKNKQPLISINTQRYMPLASIYKLVILKTYLDQCEEGTIRPDDLVHIQELKCYWIRWIDPGFTMWYDTMNEKNKFKKDRIALREIVQGMLEYSCNAHTDYLLSLLGMTEVQEQLTALEMADHDPIMPICTSVLMFLRDTVNHRKHTSLTLAQEANTAFETLLQGKRVEGLDFNLLNHFDYKTQCDWSDALPNATVHTYTKLLTHLQERQQHDTELQKLMRWFGDLKSYKGFTGGMKLGYTPKVFNTALYVTDKEKNTYQLIYFLNNLTVDQKQAVELASNDFNLNMLKNPLFVDQLKNQVDHVNIC
jgi:D-alanyl-D-alanine carboxypeptidase